MRGCPHDVKEIRKRRGLSGVQFAKQCRVCGRKVGRYLKLEEVLHPSAIPWWNVRLEKLHREAKPHSNAKRREYDAAMRSPHLRKVGAKRLEFCDYQCEWPGCDEDMGLERHHLSYDRLGRERLEDIRMVCKDHHQGADILRKQGKRFPG